MQTLMNILKEENLTCVVKQQNRLYKEASRGITPIINLLQKDKLRGATLADKVIGKAAAMMMVYGGIKEVETILISEPAYRFFLQHNIPIIYETKVSYIVNRSKDGMCPMEETVLHMDDMEEAYRALIEKLAQMKKMLHTQSS